MRTIIFWYLPICISLSRSRRPGALDEMIASMRATNSGARTTQEQLLNEVGAALTQAVRALYLGDFHLALGLLLPLRYRIRAIGGSYAQRDLFAQMLITAALKSGKFALARSFLHERTALKPNSAQAWNWLAETLHGEGNAKDAGRTR